MSTTRRRGLLAVALGAILAISLAACSAGGSAPGTSATASAAKTTKTVTDEEGRKVTVPAKVTRVVALNSYIIDLLIAFKEKQTLVGWDRQSIDRVPYAKFPKNLPVVAERYQDPLDYEAIIGADPQVVLIPNGGAWKEAIDKLSPYGISVIVITPFQPDLWEGSLRIIQDLYGSSPVSKKIIALTDQVLTALKDHAPKGAWKTFYDESPYNAPAYTTSGNTGVSAVIADRAYLKNPFTAGLTQQLGQITIDPEAVIAKDPDIIFIYYDVTYGGTSRTVLKKALADYLARPGWSNLKAVKNKNVWIYNGWYQSGLGRNLSALGRAKWAYPNEFKDVDAVAFDREWIKLLGAEFTKESDYVYRLGD